MPARSRFVRQPIQAPSGRKLSRLQIKDMRGLNSTDPYGILQPSASPYLRNARMYLSENERQVAISTRQGSVFYSVPIGETEIDTETGTSDDEVQISSVQWVAQKITPSATSSITKIEIKIKTESGTSPVSVSVYSDDSGEPNELLATTTIQNSAISSTASYVTARFIEAPELTISTDYWLVFSVQQSESDTYIISTTKDTTDSLISTSGGNAWSANIYSLNYKAYGSTTGPVKGAFRYYPQDNNKKTFFSHLNDIYTINDIDGTTTSVKSSLNASAVKVRFAQFDDALFAANGYDSLMRSTGSTFADVTELSTVPSNVAAHKNRLWVVSATDKNRLEFSELADYTTWESTGFIYVPEPKSSDPITGIFSFQDTLVVFTKNNKFVIYGDDLATFTVRQSLGRKGAVSQEAIVADENFIYFVSSDGHLYRWNGSKDEQLSRVIEGDLDDVADFEEARLTLYEDRVYYWFEATGTSDFNRNFVYETRYDEWFYDTDRYVNGGIIFEQENDELVFTSGRVGALYKIGQNYSDLGKPIDFEYRTNYFDFGDPDTFKQVRRLYLHFRKTNWQGKIQVGSDVDFKNDPVLESVSVQAQGSIWGTFVWGTGVWGGDDQYFRHRMNVPGQGTHYQVRVKKTGADTPVYFIGHSQHYRNRRPA